MKKSPELAKKKRESSPAPVVVPSRPSGPVAPVPAPTPGGAPTVATVSTGSAAEGEQLYNTYCIACHQAAGEGKVGFAPFIRNPHFLTMTSDEFLRNSILQGDLVVAEERLRERFPSSTGYRTFLIDAPAARADAVRDRLTRAFADLGL